MSGSRRERDPERAWERDRGRQRNRDREWEQGAGRFRHMAGTDSLSELEELDLQDRER